MSGVGFCLFFKWNDTFWGPYMVIIQLKLLYLYANH